MANAHNGPIEASRSVDARVNVTFIPTRVWGLPPSLGPSRICFTCPISGGNSGWGGGMGDEENIDDFLAMGGPASLS